MERNPVRWFSTLVLVHREEACASTWWTMTSPRHPASRRRARPGAWTFRCSRSSLAPRGRHGPRLRRGLDGRRARRTGDRGHGHHPGDPPGCHRRRGAPGLHGASVLPSDRSGGRRSGDLADGAASPRRGDCSARPQPWRAGPGRWRPCPRRSRGPGGQRGRCLDRQPPQVLVRAARLRCAGAQQSGPRPVSAGRLVGRSGEVSRALQPSGNRRHHLVVLRVLRPRPPGGRAGLGR